MEHNNKPLDGRFQTDQVDTKVAETTTTTSGSSFDVKKNKAKGSSLKQEIAATVVANGKGATLGGYGDVATRSLPTAYKPGLYTGDNAALVGSASGTPIADKPYDGGSRVDKKLSDPNKEINFRASEQYATELEHVPYLRENKSTVGPNGNPASVQARAQKKTGLTPSDPMFDRSLDELRRDYFIHVQGQNVGETGVKYKAYPTKNTEVDYATGKIKQTDDVIFEIGDYSPRYIKAKFKKDTGGAFLSSFEVIEDDLSCMSESYDTVNASGTNLKIHLNKSEMQRQAIDAKFGSPDSPKYSPLGRSVAQPTQTVTLLRSFEIVTGAITGSCLRFANKARSYFLSRTAKDGILDKDPAYDALYGHLVAGSDVEDLRSNYAALVNGDKPFMIPSLIKRGSAALMIGIFDSPSKYKTKGDLVNQPRGLKLPLQTGMNNHAIFKTHPTFVKALNAIDTFSTIDRGYDPSSAVCITQGLRYILPYSWASALKFTRASSSDKRDYTSGSKVFKYAYAAGEGNQQYVIKCGEPILNGIAWFLEQHASAIYNTIHESGETESVLNIPVVSTGTYFSLFDLLVAGSMAYIEYERTNTCKDILDLQEWGFYPFDDLVDTKDIALSPTQYGGLDPYKDLVVKEMSPATRLQWILPEHFAPIGIKNGSKVDVSFILPYYFNERDYQVAYQSADAATLIRNDRHNISTPIIRSGVKLGFLDDYFSMEAVDNLCSTDMMMRIPTGKTNFNATIYKYGGFSDGMIALTAADAATITYGSIHKTPRLLGWIQPAMAGECINNLLNADGSTRSELATMNTLLIKGGSSFKARMYKALPQEDIDRLAGQVLGFNGQQVDRGNAFAQYWYDYVGAFNGLKSDCFDILLSASSCFDAEFKAIRDKTLFTPFAVRPYAKLDTASLTSSSKVQFAASTNLSLVSFQRALWARLQKLPFILNPFDNIEDDDSQYVDPYDFAYILGLAGWLASNIDEELDNRSVEVQDNQFSYDKDPMVEKSPLFK